MMMAYMHYIKRLTEKYLATISRMDFLIYTNPSEEGHHILDFPENKNNTNLSI